MDIVYINGLRAETIIGIHPWEREERQTIVVDLEMGCDTSRPARSDKIDYALDYAKVSEQVIALVESSEFHLIRSSAQLSAVDVAVVRDEFDGMAFPAFQKRD